MVRAAPGAESGDGEARLDTAPLTVAGVARELGVAASTLRTWDRRYGLGPSAHQAGSHRRYTPQDVARLQVMRRLTLRGVAPVDAARIATESDGEISLPPATTPEGGEEDIVVDPLTLAAAVIEPDPHRVARILHRAVASSDLADTWATIVLPAVEMLEQRRAAVAVQPGADPQSVLESVAMGVVREVSRQATARTRAQVRVLASRADRLVAHVVAGAVSERAVPALVVGAEQIDATDHELTWLSPARVLVVVGAPPGVEDLVAAAAERGSEVFLLGSRAPSILLPHVHRVRTVPAAVVEAVAAVTD